MHSVSSETTSGRCSFIVTVAGVFFAASLASDTEVHAQVITECEKSIKNLKLTKSETEFIKTIENDHKGFVESLVFFWGLAEVASVPKTATELAETVVKESITAQIPEDTTNLFAKGLMKISLKPVYDQVVLFRIGKHPQFKDYRPKGDSHRFFTCLQKALEKKLAL